jgi:hypothetical protein
MRIYFLSFREAMVSRGPKMRKGHSKSDPFNISGKDMYAWVASSFQTSTLHSLCYAGVYDLSSGKCDALFDGV